MTLKLTAMGWGLFNPTRKREASAEVFIRFRETNILEWLRIEVERAVNALPSGADSLEVILMPADPANRPIMVSNHGLNSYGLVSGLLLLQLWVSEGNMNRLKIAISRSVLQNVRQTLFKGQALLSLADWLVMEGLAAMFIAEQHPDINHPAIAVFQKPLDWDAILQGIAKCITTNPVMMKYL